MATYFPHLLQGVIILLVLKHERSVADHLRVIYKGYYLSFSHFNVNEMSMEGMGDS